MKSEGFPKRFSLSHWIEGPLEGLMELSYDVESYRTRTQYILAMGCLVMISFMFLLSMALILDAWSLFYPFISSTAFLPDIDRVLTSIGLATFFIALSFISSLMLVHVWRYMSVMLKRFENVENLFGISETGQPSQNGSEKTEALENDADISSSSQKNISSNHKGLFNILGASSSFTQDIVQNMPQVCRQIKYIRTMFFLMPLYYVILRFALSWLYGDMIGSVFSGTAESIFEILFIILSLLSVLAGLLILESGRFMEVLYARLSFLDKLRNAPPPLISDLGTPAERLAAYLENAEKCCGKVPASSSEEFIITRVSEHGILLAVESSAVLTVESVKKFLNSFREVLKNVPGQLPSRGRFIILYSPEDGIAGDIEDAVSEYILANPIVLGKGPGGGNAETVVQIMIEEEGAYGMFPFVE